MEILYITKIGGIRKEKEHLERRLKVSIRIEGRKVTIEGDSLDEYEARIVLEAINFGFSVGEALHLLDEGWQFRRIPIKSFTRRKNLAEVRGRVIGLEGKSRRTVEQISGCFMVIADKEVGLIGLSENIEAATVAVINLIKGSKHSNVYHFLEQSNTQRKAMIGDLGLKIKNKEK